MLHCTDLYRFYETALLDSLCFPCTESVQPEPHQCPRVADGLGMCTSLMPYAALGTENALQVMLHQVHNNLKWHTVNTKRHLIESQGL